jgi:hypothetical protein
MAITTFMADSFKQELLMGGHCFNATITPTVTATSGSTSVTNVSTGLNGVTVGQLVTGTGIAANAVVAQITASNAFTIQPATTAAISGGAITITGDVFKMALVKATSGLTYNDTVTNYSFMATDETSGTGYTGGGAPLINVTPTLSGTQGITSFSNPTWTSASFSTIGCLIYNTTARTGTASGPATGRACGVFSFGGTQTVTAGTFTVVMPVASQSTAILAIA